MGRTKDTGHLAHIVQYDGSNNITIPAGLKVNGADNVMTAAAMTSTLGGYVPASRIITINGTAYDLSADRSWTISAGLTSFNTRTGAITLSSGDVTTALGFTPYNATNPAGYITGISFANVSAKPTTLAGYGITDAVPIGRTITINGTVYDLSADRSWTVSANASQMVSPNGATVVAADSAMPNAGHSFIHTLALGPGGNDGHTLAMTWANTTTVYGAQIWVDTDPTNTMAFRSRSSAGAWTGWNTIIHSSNIGSQSVNYANSSGSSGSVSGLTLTSSANGINPDSVTQNQIGYNTSVSLFGQSDGGLYSSAYNSSWIHQIYGDFRTGQIAVRGKNSGSWTGWRTIIDSSTIGSQSVSYASSAGNSSTTSQRDFNYLRVNSNNHLYLDYNHGQSIIGVYSSYRYQGVFSMGSAYVLPLDGTTPGNLYGMAWSHPNAGGQAGYLNDHGLLVMVNGVTYAAISSNIWTRGNITANGQFNGSGAGLSGTASSLTAGGLSGFDKTNPSFGAVYASNWFRPQGDCGVYQQDYGGHIARNSQSSYGTWTVWGYNKGGYAGMNVMDPQGYWNNYMHESGSGGLYSQNYRGDWIWYHNAGQNCTSFNGSTTDGGVRFRVNGSARITGDLNPQGYTGFGGNVEWANGSTQYHGSNTGYNWRDWGGWGGYWWSRNGGDMIMNLYALYSVTGSISDMRYKKDVEVLPYGLNEIMQLNPIKYHYDLPKESMLSNDPDYFLGFSAQEVQTLIPEAVHEKIGEDVQSMQGMLTITYDEIIPVLVNGIKQQQVMIHNQNIRIERLENLLNQLINN